MEIIHGLGKERVVGSQIGNQQIIFLGYDGSIPGLPRIPDGRGLRV